MLKSIAIQGKEKEVLNLLKIADTVRTYRNYLEKLNLDYEYLVVSLFNKIRNV